MHRHFRFVSAAILALAACNDNPLDPSQTRLDTIGPKSETPPATLAPRTLVPVSRPLSGQCETQFTVVPLSATQVRHLDTGTCWLKHLGRTTVFLNLVIDFPAGTLVSEELTYTAPNGDVLRAAIVGTFALTGPTTVAFSGSQTFTGGTGRFERASGSAPFEGTADLATSTSFYSFEGRIAYAAADLARHNS